MIYGIILGVTIIAIGFTYTLIPFYFVLLLGLVCMGVIGGINTGLFEKLKPAIAPTPTTPATPPPATPAPALTTKVRPWHWALAGLIVLGIFHFFPSDKNKPPTSSTTDFTPTLNSSELVMTLFPTGSTIQDISQLYTFPPGKYVVEGGECYYLVGDSACHPIINGTLVIEPGQMIRAFEVRQTVRAYLPSENDPEKGRLVETLLPTEYHALRLVSVYPFTPGRYRVEGSSEYFLTGDAMIEGRGRPIANGFIELKPGQRLLGFGSKQQVVRVYLPPH